MGTSSTVTAPGSGRRAASIGTAIAAPLKSTRAAARSTFTSSAASPPPAGAVTLVAASAAPDAESEATNAVAAAAAWTGSSMVVVRAIVARSGGVMPHKFATMRGTGLVAVACACAALTGVAGVTGARSAWLWMHRAPSAAAAPNAGTPATTDAPSLLHAEPAQSVLADVDDTRPEVFGGGGPVPVPAPLAGLDLAKMKRDGDGLAAPTEAGTARLTVDPDFQQETLDLLTAHRLPEAAAVLMDVATGRVLVYASHLEKG